VKSITEDILSWSKDFLEKPNKHLNGYPVCPYAKKTRINKKIRIVEHHNTDTLLEKIVEECNNFTSNNNKICIVACNNMYVTADELHDYVHALNHVYVPQDVYLMASHPEDAEEEIDFLQDTEWESDNEFFMILIQPFVELEKASATLKKTDYYNNWEEDYYRGTVCKREQYRKLYENRKSNMA